MHEIIQAKNVKLNIPTNFFCNQKCIFCNEWDKLDFQYLKWNEDTYVYDLINRWAWKNYSLVFTSWEPTLNNNIENYISFAWEKWYVNIGIITNGMQFANKNFLDRLVWAWLNEITFSIHGSISKIHDYNTGIQWSFDKAVRWLVNVKKYYPKVKLDLSFVMNRTNIYDFYTYVKKFSTLGASTIIINTMRPEGRWQDNMSVLTVKYSQFIEYFQSLTKKELNFINSLIRKDKLNIMDIPPCIFSQCWLDLKVYWKLEKRIVKELSIIDNSEDKIYLSICKSCKYRTSCEWFYKSYLS